MKPLVIIANTPSANTLMLRTAVTLGTTETEIETIVLTPFEAHAEHVLNAGALILGSTENFGYMSGAMKDFFERIYYPCLEHTQGLPIALYIKAGNDGTGALQSMERIITGLRWRQVQAPLMMKGDFKPEFIDACKELGAGMAEGLKLGIF